MIWDKQIISFGPLTDWRTFYSEKIDIPALDREPNIFLLLRLGLLRTLLFSNHAIVQTTWHINPLVYTYQTYQVEGNLSVPGGALTLVVMLLSPFH
jgi:hypothetical protein